jgi:imidazolonepropionase-like amidohydrolase
MRAMRNTTSFLLLTQAVRAQAPTQAPPVAVDTLNAIEHGTFRLHKFMQPIGQEQYAVGRDSMVHDTTGSGRGSVVTSSFEFTDRSTHVPLAATLRLADDLTPRHYEIKGSVSRESLVDAAVDIHRDRATVRTDSVTHDVDARAPFFAIEGYAPIAMQQELVRYWLARGRPDTVRTPFGGHVTIARRGVDTVASDRGRVPLTRYGIGGLIWGLETVWLDDSLRLVAAVTDDAEFDHFEAIRAGYEQQLGTFVQSAAIDAMAELATLSTEGSPEEGGEHETIAIVGADVIDATGAPVIHDGVVVVRDGRIAAVGPRRHMRVPPGATIIEAFGKTVLPGLWDMHAHYEQVEWGPIYLASGITTARDVGNEFEFIKSVRDALKTGRSVGPRMVNAGIIDGSGPSALGIVRADTPGEGRARVRQYHDAGFEQIKIYSSVALEVLKAICVEAHRLGMTVTGHIPNGLTAYQGVEAGMDQINHIQYIAPLMMPPDPPPASGVMPQPLDTTSAESRRMLAFLVAHHTVVDPTLALFEWIMHPASTPVADFEPGVSKVPPEMASQLTHAGAPPQAAALAQVRFDRFVATVGALHRAGVPIVAGTDQSVPGYSLHREMELYVKAGFTPLEAIRSATSVPARVMHLDREVGTVTVGKRADLLIVDGHPLTNISDTRKVWLVLQGGRTYTPAPLWRVAGFTP